MVQQEMMIQQKPIGIHSDCADGSKPYKMIFTITCEGETLYDAQKLAMNVSATLEDYNVIIPDGVTIEMTTEEDVVKSDVIFGTSTTRTDLKGDDIQLNWTGNCECKRTIHESRCALSNNT